MKYILKLSIIAYSAMLFSASSVAKEHSVDAIIKQTNLNAFYAADDASAQARMKITDSQGRVQYRQFNVLRRDITDGGDQQFLIAFSKPSDVKDMVFRVEKHIQTNDDRWLFLPALDLVKRISSSDKRTSFVGSHFFYEDISGRNISLDKFTLLSNSKDNYIIKAIPKDPNLVEFAHYNITIDKQMMLPIHIEYTDKRGVIYRTIEALKTREINGIHTVVSSKVSDPSSGASTLMQFRNIKYNNNIPANVFNERSLRNPPRKWIK